MAGGLLGPLLGIVNFVTNKACGIDEPSVGDHANAVHKVVDSVKKVTRVINIAPPVPAPVKKAAGAVYNLLKKGVVSLLVHLIQLGCSGFSNCQLSAYGPSHNISNKLKFRPHSILQHQHLNLASRSWPRRVHMPT